MVGPFTHGPRSLMTNTHTCAAQLQNQQDPSSDFFEWQESKGLAGLQKDQPRLEPQVLFLFEVVHIQPREPWLKLSSTWSLKSGKERSGGPLQSQRKAEAEARVILERKGCGGRVIPENVSLCFSILC